MDGTRSLEHVADTYLRQYDLKRDQDFWAFEEVQELIRRDAETAWSITLLLIEKAPNDAAIEYVAAGPLEDLLDIYGLAVWEQIEAVARSDKRFQFALSCVWLERARPVWQSWYALMKEFGYGEVVRTDL